jgi:predicted nucleic acid-binding protein
MRLFADSFYFIALLNERDAAHKRAVQFSRDHSAVVVTTRWVLAEVADALCDPAWRVRAGSFIAYILTAPGFIVLGGSEELFARGPSLYSTRPDKAWSLTDCISFVVMSDEGVREALTGDRHFEQAGFTALLT